jgi:uncharacterized protein YaaR (DUF327 family)
MKKILMLVALICSTMPMAGCQSNQNDMKMMDQAQSKGQYLQIHHKVADFNKWKPVYEEHISHMEKDNLGLKRGYLFQNMDNQNDVTVILEVTDMAKAKETINSKALKDAMKRSAPRESLK